MSEDIFADVQSEGEVVKDNVFDQAMGNVEKTTSESQPEKKQTEKPSQGGEPQKDNTPEEKTPFHKHPRWIKTQKQLDEYRQKAEEFEKFKKDVEPLLKERQTKEKPLPDFWTKAYGDSPQSRQSYQNYEEATKAERDRIKEEIIQEFQQAQTTQTRAQQEADEFVKSQLAEMREEGMDFRDNELMKFIMDFQQQYGVGSLLDGKGNYDFRKSLQLMQAFQPKPQSNVTDIKKRIASDTIRTKGSSQNESTVPIVSRNTLRRGSWRDAKI